MTQQEEAWLWQWKKYTPQKDDIWLFREWIFPVSINAFKNKNVLDCGCGKGMHLINIANIIKKGIGIDLNTSEEAKRNFSNYPNLCAVEGDIATIQLDKKFDIVYSIGVLHHTDDPKKTFKNISRLCKNGGRVIIWVYSWEGNFILRAILEPLKKMYFLKISKNTLFLWANLITLILYAPIYTIYLLPLKFLPFYEYFKNWRRMSFYRNIINVFDKLNAPTTHFIKYEDLRRWFNGFSSVHISQYKGVSWRATGIKITETRQCYD